MRFEHIFVYFLSLIIDCEMQPKIPLVHLHFANSGCQPPASLQFHTVSHRSVWSSLHHGGHGKHLWQVLYSEQQRFDENSICVGRLESGRASLCGLTDSAKSHWWTIKSPLVPSSPPHTDPPPLGSLMPAWIGVIWGLRNFLTLLAKCLILGTSSEKQIAFGSTKKRAFRVFLREISALASTAKISTDQGLPVRRSDYLEREKNWVKMDKNPEWGNFQGEKVNKLSSSNKLQWNERYE